MAGAQPETVYGGEAGVAQPGELLEEAGGEVYVALDAVVVGEVVPALGLEALVATQIAVTGEALRAGSFVHLRGEEASDARRGRLDEIGQQEGAAGFEVRGHVG